MSSHTITKSQVPDIKTGFVLSKCAGNLFRRLDYLLYETLTTCCEEYRGNWDMFELSNDSFYIAPLEKYKRMKVVNPPNGYSREMTSDAAGITVSLIALDSLIFEKGREIHVRLRQRLLDFAMAHDENKEIMAAIG